jgi:hypothetical protein
VTGPAGPGVERIRDSLRLTPLERVRRQERRRHIRLGARVLLVIALDDLVRATRHASEPHAREALAQLESSGRCGTGRDSGE